MKQYTFTIFPYARQTGTISVPDDVEPTPEYITEHWGEVSLDKPEIDHCGCDIDDIEEDLEE